MTPSELKDHIALTTIFSVVFFLLSYPFSAQDWEKNPTTFSRYEKNNIIQTYMDTRENPRPALEHTEGKNSVKYVVKIQHFSKSSKIFQKSKQNFMTWKTIFSLFLPACSPVCMFNVAGCDLLWFCSLIIMQLRFYSYKNCTEL